MKSRILLSLSALALVLASCSTDFEVNAPFEEIPVVYGLLDPTDNVQYIRLNRAFLQEGANALVLATDPNEIYYDDRVEVRLEEYDGSNLISSTLLERVDGDTLGIPKAEGDFANVPNILYRTFKSLNESFRYRLTVKSDELEIDIAAETNLVQDFQVTRPTPFPGPLTAINMASLLDYQMRWNNGIGAKIYDLELTVYYRAFDFQDPDNFLFTDSASWLVAKNIEASNPNSETAVEYDIDRDGFYLWLADEFPDQEDVYRLVDSISFRLFAGNELLFDFVQFNEAQLGITADQVTPEFTNVEGNGLGLFASRTEKRTLKYKLSNQTVDSIACGQFTKDLQFMTFDRQIVCP
jgi:hypothetical protein